MILNDDVMISMLDVVVVMGPILDPYEVCSWVVQLSPVLWIYLVTIRVTIAIILSISF